MGTDRTVQLLKVLWISFLLAVTVGGAAFYGFGLWIFTQTLWPSVVLALVICVTCPPFIFRQADELFAQGSGSEGRRAAARL
jgi:hypothetical protein